MAETLSSVQDEANVPFNLHQPKADYPGGYSFLS